MTMAHGELGYNMRKKRGQKARWYPRRRNHQCRDDSLNSQVKFHVHPQTKKMYVFLHPTRLW
jgi:hypothetical protein